MGKQMIALLSLISLMLLIVVNPATSRPVTNDITCEEGIKKLMPCQQFFKGAAPPKPSVDCCLGATDVFHQANTTAIRRSLCECFKKAALQLGVLPNRAKQLPDLCHIPLSFPIDPKIDCSTVSV